MRIEKQCRHEFNLDEFVADLAIELDSIKSGFARTAGVESDQIDLIANQLLLDALDDVLCERVLSQSNVATVEQQVLAIVRDSLGTLLANRKLGEQAKMGDQGTGSLIPDSSPSMHKFLGWKITLNMRLSSLLTQFRARFRTSIE